MALIDDLKTLVSLWRERSTNKYTQYNELSTCPFWNRDKITAETTYATAEALYECAREINEVLEEDFKARRAEPPKCVHVWQFLRKNKGVDGDVFYCVNCLRRIVDSTTVTNIEIELRELAAMIASEREPNSFELALGKIVDKYFTEEGAKP